MIKKSGLWISLLMLVSLSLSGCGSSSQKPAGSTDASSTPKASIAAVDTTPVTLKVYPQVPLRDTEFQQFFVEPTQKKYPFITLELIKPSALDKTVASGVVPDIIFGSQYYFPLFKELDLLQDLTPYLKKYNVDLSTFNQQAMDIIKQEGDHGEIYSVPFTLNYGALFYNKDIFDKFGVPYPKDLMSWEEIMPIAKKLTRTEGDTSYIGVSPPSVGNLINAMGVAYVPSNDKPEFTGPAFTKVFSFMSDVYHIPGQIGPDNKTTYGRKDFIKNKNLAMLTDWTSDISVPLEDAMQAGFTNWDISGYPNFQDRLGYGRSVDFHLSVVSKTSKAKEQAFLVVMETVSKEVQTLASADGNVSGLNDKHMQDNYAANLKSYKGKHIQNIFKTKMSTHPEESQYSSLVAKRVNSALADVALNKKDVNTALRDAQNEAEQDIKEKKAGQ